MNRQRFQSNSTLVEIADRLKDLRPDEEGLALRIERWREENNYQQGSEQIVTYLREIDPHCRVLMAVEPLNGKVDLSPIKRPLTGSFSYTFDGGGRTKVQELRNGQLYDYAFLDAILRAEEVVSFFAFNLANKERTLEEFFGEGLMRIEKAIQACFKKKKRLGGVVILSLDVMDNLPEKALRFQEGGGIIRPNYTTTNQYMADLRSIVNMAMGGIPSPQYAPALPH
ncbi:hypothetical protein J4206_07625 [Candidatus Woesearchaeota archaeon]|nr:hypothetical protein [Candidatus Woesearchaeota archaeon]